MPPVDAGRLYGLSLSNSNRRGLDLWGKNQFNSTFPLALCLYMRDQGIAPVAVRSANGKVSAEEGTWVMSDIVGNLGDDSRYEFERSFEPYSKFSRNERDHIDLVVCLAGDQHSLPLEIKLTVVPDNTTVKKPKRAWAPELVMRPVSSAHAMMGVATSLKREGQEDSQEAVIDALRPAYNSVSAWEGKTDILARASGIRDALDAALRIVEPLQRPFLVQPIWRTKGQSLELCEQCFDVFVWSDVSVMRIPLAEHMRASGNAMTRWLREISRHVRSLYDILRTDDFDYAGIYKGMGLGIQTDKSFALSGSKTIHYIRHARLERPALHRDVLDEIVLDGGQVMLKPERRFDAAVQAHMVHGASVSRP